MRFRSQFSTNALQTLQRLTAKLSAGESGPLALSRCINSIDNVLVDLGSQILDDGLGMQVESEEELIFRTARMVINSQLSELDRAIRDIVASGSPESEKSFWQGFLDAIALGKCELWRITRIWLHYRGGDPTAQHPAHAAAYRLALGRAFEELDKMDDIPEIERLLYRGIASVKFPEIARGCEQILVAIHVRVDVAAARRSWQAQSRWPRAVKSR